MQNRLNNFFDARRAQKTIFTSELRNKITDQDLLDLNRANAVDIYLFDGGIDVEHSEFAESRTRVFSCAGTAGLSRHATGLASLIMGQNIGVAPDANLISVPLELDRGIKIQDLSGSVAAALEFSQSRAAAFRVAILPWVTYEPKAAYFINKLTSENFVVFAGAGNHKEDVSRIFPAAAEDVICVGGHNVYDAAFWESKIGSGYGRNVRIMAPAKYLTVAQAGTKDEYDVTGGTSYAAALTAGVAARFLRHYTGLEPGTKTILKYLSRFARKNSLIFPRGTEGYWPFDLLGAPFSLQNQDFLINWPAKIQLIRHVKS